MKSKQKNIYVVIMCLMLILLNMLPVYAAREDNEIEVEANSTSMIKRGSNVEIKLNLKSFSNNNIKIDTFLATIEYNEDVFEPLPEDIFHDEDPDFEGPYELEGLNNWVIEGANPRSKKFLMHRPSLTNATGDIFKLTLTVKEGVDVTSLTEAQRTIRFYNISASGAAATNNEDIGYDGEFGIINDDTNETSIILDVQLEEFSLSSTDYFINEEDKTIELVSPETSIQAFLDNFETNAQTITIVMGETTINVTVEDGEYTIISPAQSELPTYIGTNAQITFNYYNDDPYIYHISVLGDLNGDGRISPTDYSMFAKHLTGANQLTDIAKLKSANLDFEGDLTQTDRSEMAKLLVGVTEIDEYLENGRSILIQPVDDGE